MRLAIINQFYAPDIAPTAQLAASVAIHRAMAGDEVTVITSHGGYVAPAPPRHNQSIPFAKNQEWPRVYRIWTPQLGKQFLFGRLLDYLIFYVSATWRVATLPPQDIIVSLTTPPYILCAAILHKLIHRRAKVVLWNMDCYPDVMERSGMIRRGGLLSRCLRAANRILLRHIDHLVCLDHAMAVLVGSQYIARTNDGGLAPRVTVIPNWENRVLFPAQAQAEAQADCLPEAASVGLNGHFVLLYLGNTGVGHAFETVLDAAEMLQRGGDRVRFLFIGGGSRWKEIERESKRRALENVILGGYVPKEQTPAVMATAGAALITLRDEALGVMSPSKLHSNLAMGLPIIYVGPRGSNVDEALARFDCGASLRHGDAHGLVRFIRALESDRALREEMRKRARGAFDAAYCDTQTLPKFDRLFDDLHSSKRR